MAEYDGQIAAVIVEPLRRVVPPAPSVLQALRQAYSKLSVVLIFDDIVTGFCLANGSAREHYGAAPDICTLGKITGGGFPLAAIAGRKDLMGRFDKSRVGVDKWLMQLGTLSGNPAALAAGSRTMEIVRHPCQYERLRAYGPA